MPQAAIPSPLKAILACVLLSGACWWLSFDLHLHWWWPIWIAPAPILYIAPKVKASQAFIIAFLSLLIGRFSWLSYLVSVLPLVPALLFTVLYPLVFALLILPARKIILSRPPAIAIFSFPLLWTSFEFLTFLFTRDGTIASFAYTQYDLLPIMQLASITGITGITFLITLVPSALSVLAYHRKPLLWYGCIIGLPLLFTFTYGLLRINEKNNQPFLSVALACIAEREHGNVLDPASKKGIQLADRYIQEVKKLAGQGARLVLLPEKSIPVTDSTDQIISATFQQAAKQLGISMIGGFTRINAKDFENLARVFSPDGTQALNYSKVNLFEGESIEGFKAGKTPGLFDLLPSPSTPLSPSNTPPTAPQPHPDTSSSTQLNPANAAPSTASATSSTQQMTIKAGLAICKDLDFAQYMHTYGSRQVLLLFAPAWDFDKDGWWHSRIAMTRGIENGYSLVRNARKGRLTISDEKGRVLAEANSEKGGDCILLGKIQPSASNTIYSRWGDWFGWLNLLIALIIHLPSRRILSFAPRNVRRYRDH